MLPVLLDLKDHVKISCASIKLKPQKFHKPFAFDFFSFKVAISEKGEITAISMMTIMTMLSPFDRSDHTAAFFIRGYLQFQCTLYLPVQLTPKYPGGQKHRKDPLVLQHRELLLQLCFPVTHSFTSAKQRCMLLFSLRLILNCHFRPQKEY